MQTHVAAHVARDDGRAAPVSKRWLKYLARLGYSARGVIYLIIGMFTILAAWGGGSKPDSKGAIQVLLGQPFGKVLVWLLIVGLVGYVVWRLIQSILDTDDHGVGPKALAVRAALGVSAFTYATLALYALSLLGVLGRSGDGGSGGGGGSLARTMNSIVGADVVTIVLALIFLGVAGAHVWKAAKRKYADHFDAGDTAMRFIHPVSIVGLVGRGAIFAVLAVLLFYRFLSTGTEQAESPGLREALQFVQEMPFGPLLLFAIGVGLLAFAFYSFIEARWRRINLQAG